MNGTASLTVLRPHLISAGEPLQVDIPGGTAPVHPDQLVLRVRRRAHRSQHLRGGRPGHR